MEAIAQNTGLEAVPISAIRASNATCAKTLADMTVVFIGGTSGIGRNTARELFKNTVRPKAYIVGR